MSLQSLLQSVLGIAVIGCLCGLITGGVAVLAIRRFRVSKRIVPQFTTRFMYSGNLKQTNLLDAIQFLELGRREGILHIYVGRRKGYIAFVGGRIVDAFFRNTTGKEGIFLMLELDYGDFYFESKTLNQPPVITESIMDIALEWDARKYAHQGDPEGAWEAAEAQDQGANAPPGTGNGTAENGTAPDYGNEFTQHGEGGGTPFPQSDEERQHE